MKRHLLFAFLLATTVASSQKSTIHVALGLGGPSYYLNANSRFIGGGYDYALNRAFSLSFMASRLTATQTNSGSYYDDGDRNMYEYLEKEAAFQGDLSILYNLARKSDKGGAKIGMGASFVHTSVDHPSNITLYKGQIVDRTDATHQANAGLLNFVFEPFFTIKHRVTIGLRGIYRTTAGRHIEPLHKLRREVLIGGLGTLTTISTPLVGNYELGLKIGFRF
jgi:hypothetical protein